MNYHIVATLRGKLFNLGFDAEVESALSEVTQDYFLQTNLRTIKFIEPGGG